MSLTDHIIDTLREYSPIPLTTNELADELNAKITSVRAGIARARKRNPRIRAWTDPADDGQHQKLYAWPEPPTLPPYLQDRARRYERRACRHDPNPRARKLIAPSRHAKKKYCSPECGTTFKPKVVEVAPAFGLPGRIEPTPGATPMTRAPTPSELELLRACIAAHPLLALAFAGNLTDSWFPSGSTPAAGMKEAA